MVFSLKTERMRDIRPPLIALLSMTLSACTILDSNRYPSGTGKIILTFDDGPSRRVSDQLLDVLKRTETKAVFCYIGRNIEEHPEIAVRAINEGHMISLHSYEHKFGSLMSTRVLRNETKKGIHYIENLPTERDVHITHFRPPLGIKTPAVRSVVREFDMKYAHITLFVADARTDPGKAEHVMKKIRRKISKANGGAIVLHEMRFKAGPEKYAIDKSWLPTAVEDLIHWAKSQGYEFVLYPEHEPPEHKIAQ